MIERLVDLFLRWTLPPGEMGEEVRTDFAREAALLSQDRSAFFVGCWRLFQAMRIGVRCSLFRLGRWGSSRAAPPFPTPLQDAVQDVRFGVRMLLRRPTFAAVSVCALGLGIGATTTVVSVVDGVLFPDLPFPEPQELVNGWTRELGSDGQWTRRGLNFDGYMAWKEGSGSTEQVSIYAFANETLWNEDGPEELTVGEASPDFLAVLGLRPVLGRWFLPSEVGPAFQPVVLLGEAFWRQRYGADPGVVGKTLMLDEIEYTIIGVAPREIDLVGEVSQQTKSLIQPRRVRRPDLWLPITPFLNGWFHAVARLAPGSTLERATAEVEAVTRGERRPEEYRFELARRMEMERAGLPSQIALLGIPAALLLLIACGNVASLLLGESFAREREVSTRVAIGAGRGRVIRQLLTENVILGSLGGLVGTGLAYAGTTALVRAAPATSRIHEIGVNLPVLLFAVAAGLGVGLAFGLAPALHLSSRADHVSGRNLGGPFPGRKRTMNLMVAFQVAATVVLLVSGGLFLRTVDRLFAVDLGFEPENIVSIRAAISDGRTYPEMASVYEQVLGRLQDTPGVTRASASWHAPLLIIPRASAVLEVEGDLIGDDETGPMVPLDIVMPEYLETMGITLLEGRTLTVDDRAGNRKVLLVGETLALHLWPGTSAVGKRVRLPRDEDWYTVVGVFADVRYGGMGADALSPVYGAYLQNPGWQGIRLNFVVRTAVDPRSVVGSLREVIHSVDGNVLLQDPIILTTALSDGAVDERYRAFLVGVFALTALIIAAVGIFGMAARAVAQRNQEMAIRLALGAAQGRLTAFVLRGSLTFALVGIGVGLGCAAIFGRVLSGFLFQVDAHDPLTYGAVTLLAISVSALAALLPARRTMAIDPARVLRQVD